MQQILPRGKTIEMSPDQTHRHLQVCVQQMRFQNKMAVPISQTYTKVHCINMNSKAHQAPCCHHGIICEKSYVNYQTPLEKESDYQAYQPRLLGILPIRT